MIFNFSIRGVIMRLLKIEKKMSGEYINYYNFIYENNFGHLKTYEMVSRDNGIQNENDINKNPSQAVVLIVFNKEHSKLLLNREFRMAVDSYVYNLPAGIIELGETVEQAAERELMEETGLQLVKIIDVLPPSYSAVGISNEKTSVIVCEAEGTIGGTPEEDEDIMPLWVDKEMVQDILKESDGVCMSARTQLLCYLWVNKF